MPFNLLLALTWPQFYTTGKLSARLIGCCPHCTGALAAHCAIPPARWRVGCKPQSNTILLGCPSFLSHPLAYANYSQRDQCLVHQRLASQPTARLKAHNRGSGHGNEATASRHNWAWEGARGAGVASETGGNWFGKVSTRLDHADMSDHLIPPFTTCLCQLRGRCQSHQSCCWCPLNHTCRWWQHPAHLPTAGSRPRRMPPACRCWCCKQVGRARVRMQAGGMCSACWLALGCSCRHHSDLATPLHKAQAPALLTSAPRHCGCPHGRPPSHCWHGCRCRQRRCCCLPAAHPAHLPLTWTSGREAQVEGSAG